MSNVEYYNRHAQEFYDRTVNLPMYERYRPFLARIPAGGSILDAGCGSGRDARAFLDLGYQVTAFDASPELVRLASELTELPVAVLRFQEMNYDSEFDGIWSCASLLHVPRGELVGVINYFEIALKPGGYWHTSFKYGSGETVRGERIFTNFTEDSFQELISSFATLEIIGMQTSDDVRPTHKGQRWLNVLLRKVVLPDASAHEHGNVM